MKQTLSQAWYNNSTWLYALTPITGVFRVVIAVRRKLLTRHATKFKVPIIIVGNITVGGTGKTPFTIWLANWLKQQGHRPGIVSRGYSAKTQQFPCVVTRDSDPVLVSDEAALIAKRTQCPMIIDPNRVRAVKTLLERFDCDIVISDDGLQHYRLARDIEIAMVDGDRRYGNGFCLPAGPLREPLTRLTEIDFIIAQGKAEAGEYAMQLTVQPTYLLINPSMQQAISALEGKTVHAVAGIGNPGRFFHLLESFGINVIAHSFPDHHLFTSADIQFEDDLPVIMTEKDAVKCQKFADKQHWCLPVAAEVDSEFTVALSKKIVNFDLTLSR